MIEPLTLSQAISQGRLDEFIDQAEESGVGPIDEAEFEQTAATVIKTPPQPDQTSCSPRRDDSPEK